MPHGYTNRTSRDGPAVTKAYQGPHAGQRCAREAAALRGLAGWLPVPPVIGATHSSLSLGFMTGVHGQDLIGQGLVRPVLRACGQMLRRVHALDPGLAVADGHAHARSVLVHGDFGPNNVLLDDTAQEVTAILDWEWAHAGHPVEDLAWCEWVIRMHHPRCVAALDVFFDAYGSTPGWATRQHAMLGRCRALLDLCERWQPDGQDAHSWRHRLAVTESWAE
jgi:aminoglycoside phosphotransferase